MLKVCGLWFSIVESCIGGYFLYLIISIFGFFVYFFGGIVVYSNIVKQEKLGVCIVILEIDGVVSEVIVCEMVVGILQYFGGDIVVVVFGIVGLGGGMLEKLVGIIWFVVGDYNVMEVYLFKVGKDCEKNIEYIGVYVLNFICWFLKKYYFVLLVNG